MMGISGYGWVTLPPDARVPVHHGIGSYNNYRSKPAGLITWPLVGVFLYGVLIGVAGHAIQPNNASRSAGLVVLLVALALIVIAQAGAIRAARARSAGASP
jgi:hypothetical protein